MTGETEEQRINVFIKKMVYDDTQLEGRSRSYFLENFDGSQVRAYIEFIRFFAMLNFLFVKLFLSWGALFLL